MSKTVKFESQIKELEEIVNELEKGEIGLDESIEKYTKAMSLIKSCDEKLKNIDEKISKIVSSDGTEEPFDVE